MEQGARGMLRQSKSFKLAEKSFRSISIELIVALFLFFLLLEFFFF